MAETIALTAMSLVAPFDPLSVCPGGPYAADDKTDMPHLYSQVSWQGLNCPEHQGSSGAIIVTITIIRTTRTAVGEQHTKSAYKPASENDKDWLGMDQTC